ncbi:MAG: dihydroneopterin aldolase [Spirochaetes bacterium RBG_16_49_21]|nr:MAG: dihydroneopterin aldolase [Spirochaetes bacterium RBG_16_49_21]
MPMDKIMIKDLLARCIVGINSDERRDKQDVIINITLSADLKKACKTDKFEDTVDYSIIKKKILEMVENSRFFLIEALAEHIAAACLDFSGVQGALVSVEKPSALRFARSVGVEIYRERE